MELEILNKHLNDFLSKGQYLLAIRYCAMWFECSKKEAKKYVDKIKWDRLYNDNAQSS